MSNALDICREFAAYYGIREKTLRGPCRVRSVCNARDAAMRAIRRMTKCSLAEIGSYFNGRHHSTVLQAVVRADADLDARAAEAAVRERLKVAVEEEKKCAS